MKSDSLTPTSPASSLVSIRAEQVHRWRSGERPPVEDFLSRHPSLSDDTEAVMVLIYGEVLLREELDGTLPEVSEFAERFPSLADALTAQFDLHRALQPSIGTAAPRIPGFQVLRELGRGGMGAVYLARDENLFRHVAVKVLLSGEFASESARQRFRTEAEAIARLRHAHIVDVHAFGEFDDRPYLVLEYVAGGSLDQRLKQSSLEPHAAANLLAQLADAVEHAHRYGILHRDLKPANILIADPVSDSAIRNPQSAIPKITDFGLAKRLDAAGGVTETSQLLGTPCYMAPEQCSGAKDVGPAADVYSLGAILYECLTGRPPFKAATSMETLAQVRNREPVSPRTLNPAVPRDLETICLKCLEKSPERRYATAAELAADLRRFSADQPVLARPIGPATRAVRWCRRNPAPAALIVVLLIGTGATIALATFALSERDRANANAQSASTEAQRASEEAANAERRAHDAYRSQYLAHATLVGSYLESNNVRPAAAILDRYRTPSAEMPDPRGWEWNYSDRLCRLPQRTFAQHPATSSIVGGALRAASTVRVAYHPDGRRIATTGFDSAIRIWDIASERLLLTVALGKPDGLTRSLAFSSDGRVIASNNSDKTIGVWDVETGALVREFAHRARGIGALAFSPDGKLLAISGVGQTAVLFQVETGMPLHDSPKLRDVGHLGIAFSPDGKQFVQTEGNDVHLYSVATGAKVQSFVGHTNGVFGVEFMPNGKQIVTAGGDQVAAIWDISTGQSPIIFRGHVGRVHGLAVCSVTSRVATFGGDSTMRVWDSATGKPLAVMPCPDGVANDLAISPDGAQIATVGKSGLSLWSVAGTFPWSVADGAKSRVRSVAWSPDGQTLFTDGSISQVQSWNALTGQSIARFGPHDGAAYTFKLSRDGVQLATVDRNRILVWPANGGTPISTATLPETALDELTTVALSDDLTRLAHRGPKRSVRVVNWQTGQPLRTDLAMEEQPLGLAFDPAGQRLAIGGYRGGLRIWNLETGEVVDRSAAHGAGVRSVTWTPNGSAIVTTGQDGSVKLWNTERGEHLQDFTGHTAPVGTAVFSPDGRRLVTSGDDRTLRIWDVSSGQQLLVISNAAITEAMAFDPRGGRLAAAGGDGVVRVFDGRPLTQESRLESEALALLHSVRPLSRESAIERLRSRPGSSEAVRALALRLYTSEVQSAATGSSQ